MSDNDGELGSFLAGFVIGGLVGAVAALVLAPQSGALTRSQITGKGRDMVDAGEQQYQATREAAEAYAQQAGVRAGQFSEDAMNQARIILDAGRTDARTIDEDGSSLSADTGDEAEAATG